MARGNYKTGARRDRRIIDPGLPPRGNPRFFPLAEITVTPGAGSLLSVVQVKQPNNGENLTFDLFDLTGRPSAGFVRDSTDALFPCTITKIGMGVFQYEVASGLAPGGAALVVPAWDNAVRGTNGEWLGTYWVQGLVT